MQHSIQQQTLHIEIPGDILSTGVRELRADIQRLLDQPEVARAGWQVMELNLANARMIDSMGLNLLVGILKQVKERGARLRLNIRDNNLDRLLRFTRIHEHCEVVRT